MIGDCSASMRQRIALAAAFAGDYSLVVLDEPFNWLDPVAIFDLRESLRARVDAGLTLVTALHDLGTLATACDAALMLAAGPCEPIACATQRRVGGFQFLQGTSCAPQSDAVAASTVQ